jgi:hypothetical protein
MKAAAAAAAAQPTTPVVDRYHAAAADMGRHVGDKLLAALRHPAVLEHVMAALDPVINRVIRRLFPFIVLLCCLFAVLLGLTAFTLVVVVRGGHQGYPAPSLTTS